MAAVQTVGAVKGKSSSMPAGPSWANSGATGPVIGFDTSGWTVATSGSRADARAGDRGGLVGTVGVPPAPGFVEAVLPYAAGGAPTITGGGAVSVPGVGGIPTHYLMLAAGGLVLAVLLIKRRKK